MLRRRRFEYWMPATSKQTLERREERFSQGGKGNVITVVATVAISFKDKYISHLELVDLASRIGFAHSYRAVTLDGDAHASENNER